MKSILTRFEPKDVNFDRVLDIVSGRIKKEPEKEIYQDLDKIPESQEANRPIENIELDDYERLTDLLCDIADYHGVEISLSVTCKCRSCGNGMCLDHVTDFHDLKDLDQSMFLCGGSQYCIP